MSMEKFKPPLTLRENYPYPGSVSIVDDDHKIILSGKLDVARYLAAAVVGSFNKRKPRNEDKAS